MRHDCKYFSSRTFGGGDTVQRCELDAAPEAPWRCPGDCALFEPRLMEVGWDLGSTVHPPEPTVPDSLEADPDDVAALMADLEEIVDGAADGARTEAERRFAAEARKERRRRRFLRWRRD